MNIDKNLYEILNIPPNAGREEIEEAYRRASELYGGESVAVYSLYSPEERESMIERIRAAYETLIDPARKREYDQALAQARRPCHAGEKPYGEHAATDIIKEAFGISVHERAARLKEPLAVMNERDPLAAEQYRVLYTRLARLLDSGLIKTIAVTSAVKGEGKTVTSLNLSYIMAREFKKKVIVVECDLKKPSLTSNYFDWDDTLGLADVLDGGAALHEAVLRVEDTSLNVLRAGKTVKTSTEVLGSQRMKELLERLKKEFDCVIMDSPPVLPLADVNVISGIADGVILVVRAGTTPKDLVLKAQASLNGARVLGIVLNGADMSYKKYYY